MTALLTERETWLEGRRKYLGANDLAAILGLHPYTTALQVWQEKKGIALPKQETAAMRRGIKMEPYIASMYAEETGHTIRKSPPHTLLEGKPHIGVNCDYEAYGFFPSDEIIHLAELKSHNPFTADGYGEPGTDEIPHHEVIQCQAQMHVRKIDLCDLAVLFGLDDFRIYSVRYDAELGGFLEEAADKFWHDHILADCPPPITGADADSEWLKRRFPQDSGMPIRATPEIEAVCLELATARQNCKDADFEKERCSNIIRQFMGEAAVMEWSGGKPFTWKTAKPTQGIDYKRFYEQVMAQGNPSGYIAAHMCDPATWDGFINSFKFSKPGSRRFLTPFKEE